IAQYGSNGISGNENGRQRMAAAFFANFNDPGQLTESFLDMQKARLFIKRTTGRPWIVSAAQGRAAIARDQVKMKRARGAEPLSPLGDQLFQHRVVQIVHGVRGHVVVVEDERE